MSDEEPPTKSWEAAFAQGTRYSLILLNESLASTNPGESLYIAQDIVRILRRLGARAIFATYLHELATNVEALNASTDGESHIVSLVASRMGGWTPPFVQDCLRPPARAQLCARDCGATWHQL